MSTQGEPKSKLPARPGDSLPPPYSDDGEVDNSLPEYPTGSQPPSSPTQLAGEFSLHKPFPPVMNAYYIYELSVAALKTFKLCGATESDFLYSIEVHSGYSMSGPLGSRPGVILHNGTSRKHPILAASGDESQTSSAVYAFNPRSVVLMPPLHPSPRPTTPHDMVTEVMRGVSVPSDKGVAFRFSIEIGTEKLRRESFEWVKIKDTETKQGGYKLVRALPEHETSAASQAGSSSGSSTQAALPEYDDIEREVLALLLWPKGWVTWLKHVFSLEFKGSGLSGALGERWALMVVITAIRIWMLRINLKTAKGTVAIADKVRKE